jgi:hypothetical protein
VAQPSVTSVDTSQLNAGKLTISGSGFGAGPQVSVFDTFESNASANFGDPIPVTSPDIGTWTETNGNDPLYDSLSHSGKFSMKAYTPRTVRAFRKYFSTGAQEVFISYWVRLENGARFPTLINDPSDPLYKGPGEFPKDSSWKFSWLIDLDTQGNSSDLCLPSHVGYGNFYLGGNDYTLDKGLGNAWWSWSTWNRISIWVRADPNNPAGSGEYIYQTVSQEHGVSERRVNKPVFDADGASPKEYKKVHIPGWMRKESEASSAPRYDDIYVATGANSLSRVEITDSANYDQSRKVAIQPASSWSSSRITVDLNNGGFTDLSNVYVHVWDKDGNRNTTGYPLSAGGAPPLFPNNIQ